MKSNLLVLLAPLALTLAACGQHNGAAGPGDIQGLAVSGSSYNGMAIAAQNVDPSIPSSSLYYYEFASGLVRELLPAEAGNDPAVFWADGHAFFFNRQGDTGSVRVFDPRQAGPVPAALSVNGLSEGDPWDVAPLVAGRSVTLANPLGENLQTLDYTTGTLQTVTTGDLPSGLHMRPRNLYRTGSQLFILSTGVKNGLTGESDDSARIYPANVATDGTLTFADQDPSTAALDGLSLSSTNPTGFLNRDGNGAADVLGLCGAKWPGCQAGADHLAGNQVTQLKDLTAASFPDSYWDQVVDGPSTGTAYAHVQTADGQYKVVKIDLAAGTTTDIHTFADERLYGLAYDTSSHTLFVGGRSGLQGTLTLYRDDQKIGTFALDGVPYGSALVPN